MNATAERQETGSVPAELILRIEDAHAACVAAKRSVVEAAVSAGRALIQAKKIAGHGNWLPWFAANITTFSRRTATLYMQLAERYQEDPGLLSGVKTLRQAMLAIAADGDDEEEPPRNDTARNTQQAKYAQELVQRKASSPDSPEPLADDGPAFESIEPTSEPQPEEPARVDLHVSLSAPLAEALEDFIAGHKPKTNKTSAIEEALLDYLIRFRYWPRRGAKA